MTDRVTPAMGLSHWVSGAPFRVCVRPLQSADHQPPTTQMPSVLTLRHTCSRTARPLMPTVCTSSAFLMRNDPTLAATLPALMASAPRYRKETSMFFAPRTRFLPRAVALLIAGTILFFVLSPSAYAASMGAAPPDIDRYPLVGHSFFGESADRDCLRFGAAGLRDGAWSDFYCWITGEESATMYFVQ